MGIEELNDGHFRWEPGPIDVHAHPRAFDPVTFDALVPINNGREGKAGLRPYTEIAMESGIVAMIAMPNESRRILASSLAKFPEQTIVIPFPISTYDKVGALQTLISNESAIPTYIHMGLDPTDLFWDKGRTAINKTLLHQRFKDVKDEVTSLKIYGDVTEGGYNIPPEHIPEVVRIWQEHNAGKPIVMHLENEDVGKVLTAINEMPNGREIPLHIAHVSSRQELEAVIQAKQGGMNVTCEVTPHHLFLDKDDASYLSGYGCMKPTLKKKEDVEFLWANMQYIDIIASDCAPHRRSDKEAEKPTYGITNHSYMLQLLFGAVAESKITYDELYQKLCVNPRKRFNLPEDDGSEIIFNTFKSKPGQYNRIQPYGYEPFSRLNRNLHLVGNIVKVRAGKSLVDGNGNDAIKMYATSLTHVGRPGNFVK